ncbi:MAG: neutral zinc metallopeptidase [Micropruina sp.]|nr:neutral zinc metallopeptidase [Micropruina sp.]
MAPRPSGGGGGKGVLFALVVVVVLVIGGFALSSLAPSRTTAGTTPGGTTTGGSTTGGTTTGGTTTTPPVQEDPYTAPPPDMSPPKLPAPETYTEATAWLEKNAVYKASITAPTTCAMKPIDALGASTAELEAHLQALTACLMRVWEKPLTAAGYVLPRPPATVYTSPINTACGKMEKVNASYCGADQRIYYAKPLPRIFPENLQRANFLMEMILAHEFGHTIQARTGIIISELAWEQKVGKPDANVYSRRLEMQADCLAGMFTQTVAPSQGLSADDIARLKVLAFNLGDDVLSGDPAIDSGHGRGKNRQAWYTRGLDGSLSIGQCNTFTVAASSVR